MRHDTFGVHIPKLASAHPCCRCHSECSRRLHSLCAWLHNCSCRCCRVAHSGAVSLVGLWCYRRSCVRWCWNAHRWCCDVHRWCSPGGVPAPHRVCWGGDCGNRSQRRVGYGWGRLHAAGGVGEARSVPATAAPAAQQLSTQKAQTDPPVAISIHIQWLARCSNRSQITA